MLMIGDEIKCRDTADMIQQAEELVREGYGVSLLYGTSTIRIASQPEGKKE